MGGKLSLKQWTLFHDHPATTVVTFYLRTAFSIFSFHCQIINTMTGIATAKIKSTISASKI